MKWTAAIMGVRVLGDDGSGSDPTWSTARPGRRSRRARREPLARRDTPLASEEAAIRNHPNTLYVVAAGNGDQFGNGLDNDSNGDFPCDYRPAEHHLRGGERP